MFRRGPGRLEMCFYAYKNVLEPMGHLGANLIFSILTLNQVPALDGARQWLHGDEPHHPLDWHPDDLEVPHETYPPALSDRANAYATTGVRRQSVHVYVQHTGRPLSCESDHEPRHM